MIYSPDRKELFARICGYFERANFNIVEAKIHTTRHGYALDTFLIMGRGKAAHYRDMISLIETELGLELGSDAPLAPPARGRISRRVRHFPVTPAVDFRPDERGSLYVLSVVASDRPGLLYGIARVLARYNVNLRTAKINTLGDRAEDVFLVTGESLSNQRVVLMLEQDLLEEMHV
jgi:[protein-PII] uridylyltransferase